MPDISSYIRLSNAAASIRNIFISPKEFYDAYNNIYQTEKNSFIRHTLINNIPFAFKVTPILYEQIIQYLADKINITPADIKLIGSAKTGFSLNPSPDYGRAFSQNSDLDFSLINQNIFSELEGEFNSWANQFQSGNLLPQNKNQETYWPENLNNCPKNLKRGFIDTNKIPSHNQFLKTQTINNSLYLIKDKLEKVHKIIIKKASLRVYKDWASFSRQLTINTESIINTLH
jgi:hypothetical protein